MSINSVNPFVIYLPDMSHKTRILNDKARLNPSPSCLGNEKRRIYSQLQRLFELVLSKTHLPSRTRNLSLCPPHPKFKPVAFSVANRSCDSFSTDRNLFLSAWSSVQKAHEDQFINSADGMLFARVKYQKRIGSTGMFNAIAASEDTLSF